MGSVDTVPVLALTDESCPSILALKYRDALLFTDHYLIDKKFRHLANAVLL